MSVIVLFDILEDKNEEARELLINNGYWPAWSTQNDSKTYRFPAHSLWKPKITPDESYDEIQKLFILNKLSPQNLLVFSFTTWKGLEEKEGK